jgi:sulfatase modifying factor 1
MKRFFFLYTSLITIISGFVYSGHVVSRTQPASNSDQFEIQSCWTYAGNTFYKMRVFTNPITCQITESSIRSATVLSSNLATHVTIRPVRNSDFYNVSLFNQPSPLSVYAPSNKTDSHTCAIGTEVTLSASTGGNPATGFQWFKDGDPLLGETFQKLTLRLDAMAEGSYVCMAGGVNEEVMNERPVASSQNVCDELYMVVDLSGGMYARRYLVSYLAAPPKGGWDDTYKTTKLVMRRIAKGTFFMGSPTNELGRSRGELQHTVTLNKDFYMGVFEVTQHQWELVMANRPSSCAADAYYATRPVEGVSYYDLREYPWNHDDPSVDWPSNRIVNAKSFMGRLRAKTGIATIDLPTESQWEYACRAGTTTALNSGKDLTVADKCSNMDELGRYGLNGGLDHTTMGDASTRSAKVGSYPANAWGLYDMHGNVWEWCLDWYGAYPKMAQDPEGAQQGLYRILRGGGWDIAYARQCRSAFRDFLPPGERANNSFGFRIACTLP